VFNGESNPSEQFIPHIAKVLGVEPEEIRIGRRFLDDTDREAAKLPKRLDSFTLGILFLLMFDAALFGINNSLVKSPYFTLF